MKIFFDLLFEFFVERPLNSQIDKEKSPGLYKMIQIMKVIGVLLGLIFLGYFLFFLYIFKDYKGN